MKFESYAQHFEDVILYYVLKNVEKGFYIDVGANDPERISVTKAFYDRGWHGVNIEPISSVCAKLAEYRPCDINLCIGLGKEHSKIELFGSGVGSTFAKDIAVEKKFSTDKGSLRLVWTLSEVYEQYPPPGGDVHFCKIDVEGYEREVLLGVKDWRKFRPWVFCIEAGSLKLSKHEKWESMLLDNDYIFALHHTINRYYVAAEREHLINDLAKINQFIAENEIWQIFKGKIV